MSLVSCVALVLASAAAARAVESMAVAAARARFLIANETRATAGTRLAGGGVPWASEEDLAGSVEVPGAAVLVLPTISVAYRNLQANRTGSLSVARTVCTCRDHCAGLDWDVLVCERFTAWGEFADLGEVVWPPKAHRRDVLAFAKQHPALVQYLTDTTAHKWHLVRLTPSNIYYTGGYGSLHFIGPLDMPTYFAATPEAPPP